VIFGLIMGWILVGSDLASPGLTEFPIVDLSSKVTITALIASFFVGGQEIRKILANKKIDKTDIVIPSEEELFLGTKFTQFMFIIRAFFILIGIESLRRVILGIQSSEAIDRFYPLLGYMGIVGSVILIDYKAKITNKAKYVRKGIIETALILAILLASFFIAEWIRPYIALPEIFFAMILSVCTGMIFINWKFGPTIRSLLFAGIPVVLAANFMVGGSRIAEAFQLSGVTEVLTFGFFGQLLWMFGVWLSSLPLAGQTTSGILLQEWQVRYHIQDLQEPVLQEIWVLRQLLGHPS
jgi:hypothetical protein